MGSILSDRLRMTQISMLSLPPLSKDGDFNAIKKKKPRCKKAKTKWNNMWFIPMNILNYAEILVGGKKSKRRGFENYERLACKTCNISFHKNTGMRAHSCPSNSKSSSFKRPQPSFIQPSWSPSIATRKSARISSTKSSINDEIQIVDSATEGKIKKSNSATEEKDKKSSQNFLKQSVLKQRKDFNNYTHRRIGNVSIITKKKKDSDDEVEVLNENVKDDLVW